MNIIGQELAVIRKHLGLSVGDIQHRTKLSKDIIESIENGLIFDRNAEKNVYLRTYIRSYARALKIDDTVVVKALDQLKAGNYNHLLLDFYPELDQSANGKKNGASSGDHSELGSSGSASQMNSNVGDDAESGARDEETERGKSEDAERLGERSVGVKNKKGTSSPSGIESQEVSRRTATLPGDEPGKEINWAQMGKQFNQPQKKFSWKKTIGWTMFIILILVGIYVFLTLL